ERLGGLRAIGVLRHEAGPCSLSRLAYPDLAVRMQAATTSGRHGRMTRALKKACVRLAAVRVNATVACDDPVPCGLALLHRGRVLQRRSVELVPVELDDDLVAVVDEGDRTAERRSGTDMTDHEAH